MTLVFELNRDFAEKDPQNLNLILFLSAKSQNNLHYP
ncbi:hypothetical protein BACCAP_03995 [Pseudoflavonifractor capillosus ATCC 29799]|uniref:Uncharacterized protein n=1 Tax=Pseudoflavonifractor capillosus ATCC 29799 TaxID=411467 RepID=A6P0I4_9FIRM|nr:hypothetical protein BACCAP_03995 [Pseudoflavonifractor capillosus ATCC 29799]